MLLTIPKEDKFFDAKLHMWAMQWTPMENGA
jgi:hypothetical protein